MLLIILVTIASIIALFFCGMTAWQIVATLNHRLNKKTLGHYREDSNLV